MKNLFQTSRLAVLLLLLCVAGFAASARADVKIKIKNTSGGQSYEQTTYIKGKRERTEMTMSPVATVQQCDMRRTLEISAPSKTYKVDGWADDNNTSQPASDKLNPQTPSAQRKGGLVTTTITTKDTGERKQMFGYTARHLIITMVTESTPDACAPSKTKMEIDGWYIDAAFAFNCGAERYKNWQPPQSRPDCRDRYETKQLGATAKQGYAVWMKTTMFNDNGEVAHVSTLEVVELSQATLDASLFDVPAGYTEVQDSNALYAAAAAGSMSRRNSSDADDDDNESPSNSGMSANVRAAANSSSNSSANAASTVGEKKAGVIRLGLAAVKTGSVGSGLNAAELAAAIRNTLVEYLKSPNVELVQMEARLPSQIDAEAKQKECDFVVYASVSHKKGGGGGFGGMFGKIAPSVIASAAPAGGYAAAHVASNAVYTAATMSESVKSKDEISLDVKLQAPGGSAAPALSKGVKAKAKSDGEDIISPLIEQIAQAILDTAAAAASGR